MRKTTLVAAMAMVAMFAGNVSADDTNVYNENENTQTTDVDVTNTATANATGGKAVVNFRGNERQLITAPGGYQVNLIAGPDSNKHHRTAQSVVVEYGVFTQVTFNSMVTFLEKAHEMDDNTRDWKDLREDLVIQPRFDHPYPALSDTTPVYVLGVDDYRIANIQASEVVGYLTVRDRKPKENSVDSMYFVEAAYPYAKLGGANVLVKVDSYFWTKVKSGSWGAGIGSALSTMLSCLTSGGLSGQMGMSSGNAMEHAAGGEMYLALHITFRPCPPPKRPCPPTIEQPKQKPCPPPCTKSEMELIQERINIAERKIVSCTTWCYDNEVNRRDAAEANIDMFICTRDIRYLKAAKFHYLKLRENYTKGGASIQENKRNADVIMSKAFLDWAICIKTTEGKESVRKFIKSYNLDMNPNSLPSFTK
jgi:hypothetical protein